MEEVIKWTFVLSIFAIISFFFLNPLFVYLVYLIQPLKRRILKPYTASVSLIIVVHNGEKIIAAKLDNSLSLDYGACDYEIIVVSDGSYDKTDEIVKGYEDRGIRFIRLEEHAGKYAGINAGVEAAKGEILVFTDADAMLSKDAIPVIMRNFSTPDIGGVSGRRVIGDTGNLKDAQRYYVNFDTAIKQIESLSGSISSNDGKLFAIRKSLFKTVPPSVTDDLFLNLAVVSQGFRFVYEHGAEASISTPSRNPEHEIIRRKRIVTTSLRGIAMYKELLNPFNFGLYSINLFVNKIVRRLLPVFLITLFMSSLLLARVHVYYAIFFGLQAVFYLSNIVYLVVLSKIRKIKLITRLFSVAFYFTLGNYGTLLGVIDYLRGKEVVKWVPIKND
ncbi:glycosyltransferase [Candidatus Magnetominusculus xianensis]|uniref:Glycosyl transferase n=1 Tax=Candidatus Magnetominusculus xianensis TaxID=1748249 RepID=A0ABR5SEY2_9BACT|nr:glycosyltransferase [Candidatus Magnetominusculus xianensis]KWT82978.1 glycosyl transferase [Candidatus Magnetominusculus xianensis]MBF0403057.1 glycosyltransferase [Nitrospirota bacterium]